MSPREWVIISLLFLTTGICAGALLGWNARTSATADRYIRALAEKHETQARYWEAQTNAIITNNTLEVKRREKR